MDCITAHALEEIRAFPNMQWFRGQCYLAESMQDLVVFLTQIHT